MNAARLVTLLSDFGLQDAYVGIMKGVMLGIAPDVRFVDLTHDVPAQDVVAGALVLRHAVEFFPPGTVHLAVVDPGVGTARAPVAVVTDRGILVGPDNGLLCPAAEALGLRGAYRLAEARLFREPVSRTFHGRDIFAPVAAHLAAGAAPAECGPPLPRLQPLALPQSRREGAAIRGEIVYVDRFGNLVTNIDAAALDAFPTGSLFVTIADLCRIEIFSAYAAAPDGAALAVVGSWGLLEVAVRNGSAAARFAVGRGVPVTVRGA